MKCLVVSSFALSALVLFSGGGCFPNEKAEDPSKPVAEAESVKSQDDVPAPPETGASDDEAIFRSGNEVIAQLKHLDQLRQIHKRLDATVHLTGTGGEIRFDVDLSNPLTSGAIVIDVSGYGTCKSISLVIKSGEGKTVHTKQVAPIPVVTVHSDLPVHDGEFAAIEPGSKMKRDSAPRIPLPDVAKLRKVKLARAKSSVTAAEITYPVVADADLPGLASQNYVIVSRQSFDPDDETKRSLYFSYRKAIFDEATTRLKKWRKLLVEVPLNREWLKKQGDEVVTLPLDRFAIHTTDELERFPNRWDAPKGYPILGESSTGLAQGGQSVDTDDKGRIYFTIVPDGAGIVRFNPHTGIFEQPPVNFHAELLKFIPPEGEWRRSWDAELTNAVCTRGRLFIVFSRNYRVNTPNGKFETCSGVISVSQENWDDTEAFRKDIRLHAGCWSGAPHRLYQSNVPVDEYSRKLSPPVATTHGIVFGSWRLDLDEDGNTQRLVEIDRIQDTVATNGTPLPPTKVITVNGLPKQLTINAGLAGRKFLEFAYGEFEMSRSALALMLPGAPKQHLVDTAGRYPSTFDGAPPGKLTVKFDITTKIMTEPQRYGELATALSGMSQGPNYTVIPIPHEPDQAIGVCEYSYYYSKLDFSRRASERKVFKSYLPSMSNGQKTSLPLNVGLGPYNATWVEHDNALWLYMGGYTGMSRLKYAEGGRPLEAFTSDTFHPRLAPQPIDGQPRGNVKDYLHFVPAVDGRLFNIGRGRVARGGSAYSAGLELFDPSSLGKSRTSVVMNRCHSLYTPVSRMVVSTAGNASRQEIYVASGHARPEYVESIDDPANRPKNEDPKIFVYDCESGGKFRDRYGFSLPLLTNFAESSGNIVISPCRQFLVTMQGNGVVLTYHIAQQQYVDGVQLLTSTDKPIQLLGFKRPSATIWTAPNGQIFFLTALDGARSQHVNFFEVTVSTSGRLLIRPHLAVTWDGAGQVKDYDRVVRCFLPDLTKRDGSYDFVLGGSQDNGGQPTVRVIEDFVPSR